MPHSRGRRPPHPTAPRGRIHVVEIRPEAAGPGDRDTIGGWPVLAAGEPWPRCHCGTRMVFFFQLDIPADIPAFGGDQLSVFQCPTHDEVPEGTSVPMRARYWDEATQPYDGPFWRILVRRADTPAPVEDPYVRGQRLAVRADTEKVDRGRGAPGFKLGGVPSWAQDPVRLRCACDTELVPLCQVPENFGADLWPMKAGWGDDQVQLFLGNEVYILACPARCHPQASWPVAQN